MSIATTKKTLAANTAPTARKGRTSIVKDAPYDKTKTQVANLNTYSANDLKGFCKDEGLAQSGTKSVLISRLTGYTPDEVTAILAAEKAANTVAKTPKAGSGAEAKLILSTAKKEEKVIGAVSKLTAPEAKAAVAVLKTNGTVELPKKPVKAGTRDWYISLLKAFNAKNPASAVKGYSTLKVADAKAKCRSLGLLATDSTLSDVGTKLVGA